MPLQNDKRRWECRELILSEWLQQHERYAEATRILKTLQADTQPFRSCRRSMQIGTEQSVPPREKLPVIRILLADYFRVVDTVHVRCDKDGAQRVFDHRRQHGVRVREETLEKRYKFNRKN